jgi:CHAT domain-containing protein/tetratricopeptide (TPR) repeat protein
MATYFKQVRSYLVRFVCLVFLLTFPLWTTEALAQSSVLSELRNADIKYEQLYSQGRYHEAEQIALHAVELSIRFFGPDSSGVALYYQSLGDHYLNQGDYTKAEPFYRRSLKINEKEFGPDDSDVEIAVASLAQNYYHQNRYEEAEPLFRRSLKIRGKLWGQNDLAIAVGLVNLAANYVGQNRFGEAEPLLTQSQSIREKVLGRNIQEVEQSLKALAPNFNRHPYEMATSLFNLAKIYGIKNRFGDAMPLYKISLVIRENILGYYHLDVAKTQNNLAFNFTRQGFFEEATFLYKNALEIREKILGPDHPEVAIALNNLALNYDNLGHYTEAEPLHKHSLQIYEKALGQDHPDVALYLNNLAHNYMYQARFKEAEHLYKRSLEIWENVLGPDHPDVALGLNNLATNYDEQGRYSEAEQLYKRSLDIRERILGRHHYDVAMSLGNLAVNYNDQGRHNEAESLHKRSLEILEKSLGPDHPDVALGLSNLAANYDAQGRYSEAEQFYKRYLEIVGRNVSPNHPDYARALAHIANNYNIQGRYEEEELLIERSLSIREKTLGPYHPDVARSLNNLAINFLNQGRYDVVELLLKRSLSIIKKALGRYHPEVASIRNNLAASLYSRGIYGEAELLLRRSLEIQEKVLGQMHPDVAETLSDLAILYHNQDRLDMAETMYKRSLEINEQTLGPNHPKVAMSLGNLAFYFNKISDPISTLDYIRRSTAILWRKSNLASEKPLSSGLRKYVTERELHIFHVRTLLGSIKISKGVPDEFTSEAFTAGQIASFNSTGNAVSRMAVRFASGNDELAKLARMKQDAEYEWRKLDKEFTETFSIPTDRRNEVEVRKLHQQINNLEKHLENLNTILSERFPKYAALNLLEPLPLTDAQSLLSPDEALVTYLIGDEESYLWVLRRDRANFQKIWVTRSELERAIKALREGLAPSGVEMLSQVPSFDTVKAYVLYWKLFAPAEQYLEGVRHVMVVPDGALQSLPLGVLVTKKPTATEIKMLQNKSDRFSGYRQVPWLAKKYALSTLPSVSSLKALRVFAKKNRSTDPFTGFGDPVLNGDEESQTEVELASLFIRGSVVDVAELKTLRRLPDTADELKAMAASLNADEGSVYLGNRATERRVKEMDLSNVKVLAFATHGLLAGKLTGVSEPGLVLTPPVEPNEKDDGFLTASEVAQLKLNADWVILSACDTASSDGTPGAEGLSGLAKAFFYAGSKALLVSHWPVLTEAAKALTTKMLTEASNDNGIGRAEALKRSIISLINTPNSPHYAHPMFWAPFTVVGEGG